METLLPAVGRIAPSVFRDVVLPKEHGSWSLAFEPIALSLLVAPSVPGASLGLALVAGFFARRPLRIAAIEHRAERQHAAWRAFTICVALAVTALVACVFAGGVSWLIWLLPTALVGTVFAALDVQGSGRAEAAEIAGAASFALTPAAFAVLAGWRPAAAAALAVLALGRAVPSVLCVRAFLRGAKTGVRRDAPALVAACIAVVAGIVLVDLEAAPFIAHVAMVGFAARAFALLLIVRPEWRARTVGMIEAALGVLFVVALAIAWRL